jgi:DNA modification methylase
MGVVVILGGQPMPTTRLMLGDCVDRMAGIETGSVDLILTSPPYDNLRTYAGGSAFDFEATAGQCKRVLGPGGVIVWVVGDQTVDGSETGESFRQALHFKAIGLDLHDTMIYRKANPAPLKQPRYQPEFEFMFVASKGRPRVVNLLDEPCRARGRPSGDSHRKDFGDGGGELRRMHGYRKPIGERKPRGNIWTYAVGINPHGHRSGHPATFPLPLAVDHVLSWTNPGDLVLDPFLGSGTVLEACLKTDRRGIGIDISPEYLAMAEERLAAVRADMPLFPATA